MTNSTWSDFVQVSVLRAQYLEKSDELGYVEEIHFPIMLILTKSSGVTASI